MVEDVDAVAEGMDPATLPAVAVGVDPTRSNVPRVGGPSSGENV